jgi:hypothetical protein
VLERYDVPPPYFGEGITALRDTIYQLTWTTHVGFAYVETDSFELVDTYPYPWEGWGLTHDGTRLIASDGSSTLRYLDPTTQQQLSQISVHDEGSPVNLLNELEYVGGWIYANVYFSDVIAVIHPVTGAVESWLDLGGLRDSVSIGSSAGVLNGIAFEPDDGRLFVTGKRWARLFEIDVEPLHSVESAEPAPHPLILRVYPNPARQRAHIVFGPPSGGDPTVTVFDLRGRAIPASVDRTGARSVALDTRDLAPGAYLVRLVSRGMSDTRKILVAR